MSSNNKNNYESYIATYQLSIQEINEIAKGKTPKIKPTSFTKTNQKIDSQARYSSVFDCASIERHTVSLCRDAKGNVIENDGQLGNGCVGMGWDEERVTIIIDTNCFSSGSGGGGDSGGGVILPIGGGGGGTSGIGYGDSGGGTSIGGTSDDGYGSSNDMSTNIFPNGIYTSPILSGTEIVLLNELTEEQLMWWQNTATPENKQSIITYLLNNTSPEGVVNQVAKESAKEIINDILNIPNEVIDITNVDIIPPSCESFKFKQTASNWQESAVENISFRVFLVTPPNNITYNYEIAFPKATLFSCPTELQNGTKITPEIAAAVSAKALDETMKQIVKKYGRSQMSPNLIEIHFQKSLKYNFDNRMPGGRVNFNATNYSVTPTQYKTNTFGTGNCN